MLLAWSHVLFYIESPFGEATPSSVAEVPITGFFSHTELLGMPGTPVLQKLARSQLIAVRFWVEACM